MAKSPIAVFGLGGDALTAPEHTMVAFWAALGCGASGIVTSARLSRDGQVVCSQHDTLSPTCGDNRRIADLDWQDIRRLDAGTTFRSTQLDNDYQPTGVRGLDTPWSAANPPRRRLNIPRLQDVLSIFARRCDIAVLLPSGEESLANAILTELRRFGVSGRVRLVADRAQCTRILNVAPEARCILSDEPGENPGASLAVADELGTDGLYVDWDVACPTGPNGPTLDPDLRDALRDSTNHLYLGSVSMPFAATPAHFSAIRDVDGIAGIFAPGVGPAVETVTPPAVIAADDFRGTRIDRNIWAAGYSHPNQDTEIFQDDALHIRIRQGGSYSGAAAVCVTPIHGRFDAQVDFEVDNPRQATTFELAAICIDPGYFNIDNTNLGSSDVNLTFDVHGAPPYASSERDEADGFRCGWNNSFNITRIDGNDWSASSVNMYNKYGRDVGDGGADNPTGTLRLVRNGQIFVCQYRDKHNSAWVCSGTMLVQNLADDVFIRLAAKHWAKGGTPPSNHVRFQDFKVYQF